MVRMNRASIVTALGTVLLCACQPSSVANSTDEVPAVIVAPTAESRAELQRAVSNALGGVDVLLADDALTGSSLLIVERRHRQTIEGRIGDDRSLESSEQFRLMTDGSTCVLAHLRTESRFVLPATSCAPGPH
jgi:hypothetical protein